MSWLDDIKQRDGVEKWLELIETLRTVTEGKVRRACLSPHVACNPPVLILPNRLPVHSALFGNTTGPRDSLTCTPP